MFSTEWLTPFFDKIISKSIECPILPAEESLLSKGLSFCPRLPRLNSFELKQDLHVSEFSCQLRLKEYFNHHNGDNNGNLIPPFWKKSNWIPPINRNVALEMCIKVIHLDINSVLNQGSKRHYQHNQALVSLRSRTDIIIKKQIKGQPPWWCYVKITFKK